MSHTLNFGWTHALTIHAPTTPQWVVNAEHAIGDVVHRFANEHPATPVYDTHQDFIEDALMAREMYRL